jgi:molybdate transport system regulatory protein
VRYGKITYRSTTLLTNMPEDTINLEIDSRRYRIRRRYLELIDQIRNTGSLSKGCKHLGITYKTGISWIQMAENIFKFELLATRKGGRGGGGSTLTNQAISAIESYYRLMSASDSGFTREFLELKMSARNALDGTVSHIRISGEVSLVEVLLDVPQRVKTVITTDSVRRLDLKKGARVFVIIKATEAMLAKH